MSDDSGTASPHAPPLGPQTVEQKLEALFAPFARSDAPGLTVGIARHGRVVYRRAFGMASLDQRVAMAPTTRLRIGSTTKQFAALAAFLLAEEGKLDPDAPASDLLPELPKLRGMPTLRQFMTHTGGHRCSLDLAIMASGKAVTPEGTALAAIRRQTDVNFAPGEGQLYCNGGFHLMSRAVEHAAGMPFGTFLKERIFDPLGMPDTELAPDDLMLWPGLATLHMRTPGGWQRGIFPMAENLGEGGIISTVDDMLRWAAHLREPKVVGNESTWRQMKDAAVLNDGTRTHYSPGLMHKNYRGAATIGHGGGVVGGTCAMFTLPEHGLDVVLLANGGPANVDELSLEAVDHMLGDVLGPAEPPKPAADRFGHLHNFRYAHESGVLFSFAPAGPPGDERLGFSLNGSPHMPLPRDDGDGGLRIGFNDVAAGPFVWSASALSAAPGGGAPDEMPFSETGKVVVCRRLPDPPSAADAAEGLVGRYRSADLAADAEVVLANGHLTLRVSSLDGGRSSALEPSGDRFFKGQSPDLGPAGGFLLVAEPSGDFHISSVRARRVRFERVPA